MQGSDIAPDKHSMILGSAFLAGLFWVAIRDYLIFHTLIGIVTVVAVWSIFVTAWNSRHIVRNAYFSIIGIACLFTGLIELLHILSYKGMAIFGDANQSAQLGIIAHGLQSASLVVAPLLHGKRLKTGHVLVAFGAVAAGSLLSVFYWRNFPICFIEGIGPADFEKIGEYVIIALFIASIFILSLKRRQFEIGVFRALTVSLALFAISELAFTANTAFLLRTNELGHFIRLIAAYLMYRVFITTGIFAPFNRVSRNLTLSEKNLYSLLEGLPAFVFVQMPDYKIRYANRVFRDLFGDPENMTCHEILKGAGIPCEICPTREILRTGVPQHRDWGVIKDKTYAIYEYPYRDFDDSPAVLKLGIDITDRKNMETELIEARDELENRVRERTGELARTNEILRLEIAERERTQRNLERSEEELRLLSFKLLNAEEMERKRIAMELHDSLGGSISAIKFRTEHAIIELDRYANVKSRRLLDGIVVMLQDLLEEVRRMHSTIWPSVLSDFGLTMAIDWVCRRFEEDYPHIHIEKSVSLEETDPPDELKIVIFRIIQEALTNVAKHSGANSAVLRLGKKNGEIEMTIRDNGKGFDVAQARESARISACVGLSSMTERARLSGGALEIQSGGTGTEVRVAWSV